MDLTNLEYQWLIKTRIFECKPGNRKKKSWMAVVPRMALKIVSPMKLRAVNEHFFLK
jgi:hypothetical protein